MNAEFTDEPGIVESRREKERRAERRAAICANIIVFLVILGVVSAIGGCVHMERKHAAAELLEEIDVYKYSAIYRHKNELALGQDKFTDEFNAYIADLMSDGIISNEEEEGIYDEYTRIKREQVKWLLK